jgi:hypothetical protein
MRTKEVFVTKSDGEIVNKKAVRQAWESVPPNGRFLMKIESKSKRSLPQNSYYWACVVPMIKEGLIYVGYDEVKTEEDAHEILKHLFLKQQIASTQKGGEVIEFTRSTTHLTKEQFSEYLESIYRWASEFLNIYIPEPNKQADLWSTTNQYFLE